VGDKLPVEYKLNTAFAANACTPLAGADSARAYRM